MEFEVAATMVSTETEIVEDQTIIHLAEPLVSSDPKSCDLPTECPDPEVLKSLLDPKAASEPWVRKSTQPLPLKNQVAIIKRTANIAVDQDMPPEKKN